MHALVRVGHGGAHGSDGPGRQARHVRRFQTSAHGFDAPRRAGDAAVGLDARGRHAVGGELGGILGALTAVERVVEGETVVARHHRGVGTRERGLRGGEFFGGVHLGAGRKSRVDRALRLLHLFLRGVAAACRREQDEQCQEGPRAPHQVSIVG